MTFKSHSRSSKISRFDRAHYFLLPYHSNYVRNLSLGMRHLVNAYEVEAGTV